MLKKILSPVIVFIVLLGSLNVGYSYAHSVEGYIDGSNEKTESAMPIKVKEVDYSNLTDEEIQIEELRKGVVTVERRIVWEREYSSDSYNKGKTYIEYSYSTRGTGFLVGDGYVITNEHIALTPDQDEISYVYFVKFYNQEFELDHAVAEYVASDIESDLALIKFDAHLTPVEYLDKTFPIYDEIDQGDRVKVIGHPTMPKKLLKENERFEDPLAVYLNGKQINSDKATVYWRHVEGIVFGVNVYIIREKSINGLNEKMIVSAMSLTTQTFGGNSGSPVIDENGYAIGVISGSYEYDGKRYSVASKPGDLYNFLLLNNLHDCLFTKDQL